MKSLMLKTSLLVASVVTLSSTLSLAAAPQCGKILLSSTLHLEKIQKDKKDYARKLISMGLSDTSYVSRWKATSEKYAGPLAPKGELVVSVVPKDKVADWFESVGKNSIGFTVDAKVDRDNGGLYSGSSALIRIGKDLYSYHFQKYDTPSYIVTGQYGKVETTIQMEPHEIEALREFFNLRARGQIRAQFDVYKRKELIHAKGDPINTRFELPEMGIFAEGCAGRCSSFALPEWQAHLPPELKKQMEEITEKYGLFGSPVPRQLIWRNARNPHALGITLFESNSGQFKRPTIEEHSWGNLRGMAVYGTVPDPKGPTKTVDNERIPLNEWLRGSN